ncbi:UTRA domain-containing protein [Streptomyces sp. 8K308]|uniref:UTRA domain-containing protein n=1 Tax=Streptomyces sp. 8K308 TaxID=2530388 RepID=UPI001FB582CC|nr:UTRA domain-containing protein [Streptomyces sp. 8K308]
MHGRAGSGVLVREPTALRAVVRSWYDERLGGTLYVPDDGTGRAADGSPSHSTAVLPAPVEIAERLGIDQEAPVVRSEYTFLAGGEAGMLSTSWEPLALTEGTPVALPDAGPLAGHGVVARMAHIGVAVDRATESVTGRAATPEEAERLGLAAGAQVQALQRTYYAGDRAVETADLVIPASRFRLVYEFPVDG